MSTDNVILDELNEYQNGSPSKSGGSPNNLTTLSANSSRATNRAPRQRSRSRSPLSRQKIYENEGTNTTSDKPHLQRARLFVGNIDQRIHRSEVRRIFARYGEVLGVSVHKGYAFVQMDRERHANNAILGEDNRMLKGARLHVEFSQAAKKAGARFEEDQLGAVKRGRSPPPSRGRHREPFVDDLEEREAKLARVLAMEKELAYLRSQEHFSRSPTRDIYERREHRNYSPPRREYERGGYDRRSSYYDRQSPPISSPPRTATSGPYRDSFSIKREPSYESRDTGYARGGEPNVGYGGSSGRMNGGKLSSAPPPGWPTSGFGKSNPNQRPFSSSSSSWN